MKIDAQIAESYDAQYDAPQMKAWRQLGAEYKFAHIRALTQGRKFEKALDVGAGDGSILSLLDAAAFAKELYAVEISDSGLRRINERKLAKLKEAQKFDGYSIPYPDKFFDVTILSHVLEHVEFERALLREIRRVSRLQIIETPRDYHWNVDERAAHFLSYGHINLYTPTSLRFLLKTESFEIIAEHLSLLPTEILRFQHKKNNTPPLKAFIELTKHALRSGLFGLPSARLRETLCYNMTYLLQEAGDKAKIF